MRKYLKTYKYKQITQEDKPINPILNNINNYRENR